MANLIPSGGAEGMLVSFYGMPHPATLAFIDRQVHQATDTLTAAGRQFMTRAEELYDKFSSSHAMRMMRAAARAATHFWESDTIRYLADIGAMQNAPPSMHRWIMAEPTIRELYHANRCDGYSDTYVDAFPSDVGEAHYDYRRVTNGVVMETEDGGWKAATWNEDLLEEDRELSMEEKCDILDTWWGIKQVIEAGGEDPTSRYNADLG